MMRKLALACLAALAVPLQLAAAQGRQSTRLVPPVSASCISSPFGPRVLADHPAAGTYHYGIDLPAPLGAAVVAAAPGTVLRIQRKGPGGLEMLVQHDGFMGIYSHFGMIAPAFAEGKRTVEAGEKLGVVGHTGVTSGAHLYFGMVLDGRPVDPALYLRLPLCSGSGSPLTASNPPANDGATIGGRRYYQVFLPERQYYNWGQH